MHPRPAERQARPQILVDQAELEQLQKDAALGRLVRQMPGAAALAFDGFDSGARWMALEQAFCDYEWRPCEQVGDHATPEAALEKLAEVWAERRENPDAEDDWP